MRETHKKDTKLLAAIGVLTLLAIGVYLSTRVCISAFLFKGVLVGACPDGRIRQTVFADAWSLHRGAEGTVRIGAVANYTSKDADDLLTTPVRRFSVDLSLVKPKGEKVALVPKKGWHQDGGDFGQSGAIVLPDVPDGEYTLRAHVRSSIGDDTLDVPLPIYAPARIHAITDRPLYQPGNTVQFRAVVLRARDLVPLDQRPGRWIVTDPSGETVFEEKAPAGDFGVASGSFPLDDAAPSGDWRVRWTSGTSFDEVTFRVEPFTLPRFRVEASAPKPFYRAHEKPIVRGKVTYSSGAPVANAQVEVAWSVAGAWPPPTAWLAGVTKDSLPKHAAADASGNFTLELPEIPKDLKGKATLIAALSAVDPAGDRVEGSTSIMLSEDAIDVQPVTELEDGLVEGFNNRLYLRASSAAGSVLAKTKLVVKRAWQPRDQGIEAMTDEDGVAAIQIDPGPAVNVVIPPMPARPPPRPPVVQRTGAADLMTQGSPSLVDQRAMDAWNGSIEACERWVGGDSENVVVGLRVDPSGTIGEAAADARPLSQCVAAVVKAKKLPAGRARVYQIQYALTSDLPRLSHSSSGSPSVPSALEAAITRAALDARSCLPREVESTPMASALVFSANLKKGEVALSFAPDPEGRESSLSAAAKSCIEAKLKAIRLPRSKSSEPRGNGDDGAEDEAEANRAVGVARFLVEASARMTESRPQATTMIGYELKVEASAGDEKIGSTKVLLRPGSVPPIRLRAQPILAEAGGDVDVTLIRGPSFTGQLPEKLHLSHERGSIEAKVDPKTRTAKFKLPADGKGWFQAEWGGGRAFVYVRPKAELAIKVTPKKTEYAPGEDAEIAILTTAGDRGTKAGVGLIGVDQSLEQLVALPGPDAMARIRPKASMSSNAFGVLDAEALTMGRIRGSNAAAATILRVVSVPAPPEIDASITVNLHPSFEPLEALTDHFYTVLAELYAEERAWEEKAPKDEQMKPTTMAKLWEKALDACEKKKQETTDAYGRRLKLHHLPPDLLALTDPRHVVVSGTRLPEDIENWAQWVMKERP
jgi:MG2 domain-containing protein